MEWRRCAIALGLFLCAAVVAGQEDEPNALVQAVKLSLWQRGEQQPCGDEGCVAGAEPRDLLMAKWAALRHQPIMSFRGGADGCSTTAGSCEPTKEVDIDALRSELGAEFSAAIDANIRAHEEDIAESCASFYCGDANSDADEARHGADVHRVVSHPMGSVPPEDFAAAFKFPLDLIKVTSEALIPPEEAEEVVAIAKEEGLAYNEYTSGKYKLGGDWVKKMPRTLAWFNRRLESTIFPTIASTFPEVVRGPQVLRAHSVAILKYNASHPRTDVHVDNGILALTLSLSPRSNYTVHAPWPASIHTDRPPFTPTGLHAARHDAARCVHTRRRAPLFISRLISRLVSRLVSRLAGRRHLL